MKRFLCILLLAANSYGNPVSFRVEGTSMYPAIKPGDIVFTDNKINLGDLRDGDIIVFVAEGDFVVHRLHKKNGKIFTKGDNNPEKDKNYLNNKTLIGKVIKII